MNTQPAITGHEPISWCAISGSPNYVSGDGRYVAVFKHAFNGHECYYVFPTATHKSNRVLSKALSAGGLPRFINR